jgi:hypothetical protein
MPDYSDLVPEPDVFYGHLNRTLEELPDRIGNFRGELVTPEEIVESTCREFSGQDPENWELDISPNWQFKLTESRDFKNTDGRAVIGGNVTVSEGNYEQCSFNLSILQRGEPDRDPGERGEINKRLCCIEDRSDRWNMVRRFHFDMDIGGSDDEAKPVCHLQTGGKMSGSSGIYEELHYCRTRLKKPRIPHPPMDLALILDMLFSQYSNLQPYRDTTWLGFVKRSEYMLWKHFFEGFSGRYTVDNPSDIDDAAMDVVRNQ